MGCLLNFAPKYGGGVSMYDNNVYNLMSQTVEVHRALWRIKNTYKKDAQYCKECLDFWNSLEKDLETRTEELDRLLQEHMKIKTKVSA